MLRNNILVTGATGKQGTAVIRALLRHSSGDSAVQYHIYALTRKASSPSAQYLVNEKEVTVVEGDLDVPESISKIFEEARENGGIWGVFAVLAYPGLGVEADGEERQGKMLADIALKYGVTAYIYSSSARAGPKYEDGLKLSGLAKSRIEQYCKYLGERGLPWTILRPAFFMENFDDFIGSITVSILKTGLKSDTEIALIGSEDIGNVTAAVFDDHEKFHHKTLVLSSEFTSIRDLEQSYQRAMGRPIPAVPMTCAWLLIKLNIATQDLMKHIELVHSSRQGGYYPELDEEIRLAKEAYPMKTFHDWLLREKEQKPTNAEWNGATVVKLLRGRM